MANAIASRAARLVYIRDLLYEAPRSTRDLAALCGVSVGTICRDLIALQLDPLRVPLVVMDGHKWAILDHERP
ncbi:MAG: hypothetical protein GX657_11810 [Chloroflexi bacterium]|nr:hypothetical protein [Chloroflexota bacterium]